MHKRPSERAIKTVQLLAVNPEMSLKAAAVKAGYSPSTAVNVSANILKQPALKSWLERYQIKLERFGVTQELMANKLYELINAEEPVITAFGPLVDKETKEVVYKKNFRIQLEAIKVAHDIFGVGKEAKENKNLKRKMTIEEFSEKIEASDGV